MPQQTSSNRKRLVAWLPFCGVVLGAVLWAGFEFAQINSKAEAVSAIEKRGGTVVYDYQWSASQEWLPDAIAPGSAWMKSLFGTNYAANVIEVQLFAGAGKSPELFNDRDAEKLKSLAKVKWLVLMDTHVSDAGLAHLSKLRSLERLDLEGTKVTEAGVEALRKELPAVAISY